MMSAVVSALPELAGRSSHPEGQHKVAGLHQTVDQVEPLP
jgi:hypothetical protein